MAPNCADSLAPPPQLSPLLGTDTWKGCWWSCTFRAPPLRSNYWRQLRAALHANHKGREPRSIANGTPLPHFHIYNLELWEWGVNKCLSRVSFMQRLIREVGWGVGLGCWSAQGWWWEVRGATLTAFLARVNFCTPPPPAFFFLLFFSAQPRNKD